MEATGTCLPEGMEMDTVFAPRSKETALVTSVFGQAHTRKMYLTGRRGDGGRGSGSSEASASLVV